MAIKHFMISMFLLLILLAEPCFSRGGPKKEESPVYDIDYRGPETHFFRPPPYHSGGRGGGDNTNGVHQKRVVVARHHGSKRVRHKNSAADGKKIHG